jgi:nitrite reductase (NO-forming)
MMSSGTCSGRAVAALAFLLLALAGCGLQPSARVVKPVGPALSYALSANYDVTAPAAAAAAAPAPAAPLLGALTFHAVGMSFEPRTMTLTTPGRYAVRLVNTDAIPHDITFPDGTRIYAEAGQVVEGEVLIGAAGVSFICDLPGHREAGMVGQMSVSSALAAGDPAR